MSTRKQHNAKARGSGHPQKVKRPRSTATGAQACFCYIVECQDGTFYTGWAVNAERRVKVHNAGRGARYTRTRLPVKLVYIEPQPDRATAMKRERAIKKLTRARKQALIGGPSLEAAHAPRKKRQIG